MKKIINGKKYDTETAKCVATIDANTNSLGSHIHYGDFHYWDMSLYKKNTGEYFLTGDHCYPSIDGNFDNDNTQPILPVDEDEAKTFVENSNEDYEKIFGEVSE